MNKLDDVSRLTLLRLDAEIRACHYKLIAKQNELNHLAAQQETWKKKYKDEMTKIFAAHGVTSGEYTFDDETGELSPLTPRG